MPKEFDNCVNKVMAQGRDKSSAFAICTSAFQKTDKSTDSIDNTKNKMYDEEGRLIVAENVKFYIEAGINIVNE